MRPNLARCSLLHSPPRAAFLPYRSIPISPWRPQSRPESTLSIRQPALFRLAIIGSGPAAFYTASRIQTLLPYSKIDIYERLPTPFGLVRYGVAPDHPEVRHCETKLDEVAAHKLPLGQGSGFEFVGNVRVGQDVTLQEMRQCYDGIVLAYGASQDRELGIRGEILSGVSSGRAFVGWYNGLPEFRTWDPEPLLRASSAVIVGQGNVSMDNRGGSCSRTSTCCARPTCQSMRSKRLSRHQVRRIHIAGRRGLFQIAATLKELRELLDMKTCAFTGLHPQIPGSRVKEVGRARTRMHHRLAEGSALLPTPERKKWSLNFFLQPMGFNARDRVEDESSITAESSSGIRDLVSVDFEKTEYEDEAEGIKDYASVKGTGLYTSIEAQVAFRSIGYKAEALPGFDEMGIEFDDRKGIIRNLHGSAFRSSDGAEERPRAVPGIYAAGWCKRGPTGVIASTMLDAFDTAQSIATDWLNDRRFLNGKRSERTKAGTDLGGWSASGLREMVKGRGAQTVSWEQWKRIDWEEKRRGEERGKEREKITDVTEMLEVATRLVRTHHSTKGNL